MNNIKTNINAHPYVLPKNVELFCLSRHLTWLESTCKTCLPVLGGTSLSHFSYFSLRLLESVLLWMVYRSDKELGGVCMCVCVCAAAAAAAARSLQSCPTLCDPIDGSPPGSPVPGILQARILDWIAISFSNAWKWKVKVKSLSSVRLLATPWTAAYEAPLCMGFSRQEYWSGVPLPSPVCVCVYICMCIYI